MEATAAFDGDPASVPAARRFVRQSLANSNAEEFEYVATQLVSELATNAVIHARSRFQVDLILSGDLLRLAVTDGSLRTPLARTRSVGATTGRGLAMVAAMAQDWGVETRADGKTVWATVARAHYPVAASTGWDSALDRPAPAVMTSLDSFPDDFSDGDDDDLRPRLMLV